MTLNTLTNPMPLSAGAVWRGSQTSGQSSYDVEVRICSVDDKGDICGKSVGCRKVTVPGILSR